jgi:hypothetical protein
MPTVVTRLLGGLGNQMFQYAAARALSLYQGGRLLLDTAALAVPGGHTPRDYALDVFDIRAEVLGEGGLHGFNGMRVAESGPRFDARVPRIEGDAYLAGYWQSERYFRGVRPVLQRDFRLRRAPGSHARAWSDRIQAAQRAGRATVSLHVRRGDYVSLPQAAAHHGACETDYYLQALAELQRRHGELEVFAFSDDPAWVAANLRVDAPLHVVSDAAASAAHEDLWLMQQCRHHVIANSSFSWWGAWLGHAPQATVIAPRQWVRTPGFDTRDVVPADWVCL